MTYGGSAIRCDTSTLAGTTGVDSQAADILTIDIDDAAATRTGSSLCGPASGTAVFAEDYDISPSSLAIVPAP
jgi:hypothetical protein